MTRTSPPDLRGSRLRGFTLVEVLVATSVAAFVGAGILATVLTIALGSYRTLCCRTLELRMRSVQGTQTLELAVTSYNGTAGTRTVTVRRVATTSTPRPAASGCAATATAL
jgi:Tfp pilus assembly protein PilE